MGAADPVAATSPTTRPDIWAMAPGYHRLSADEMRFSTVLRARPPVGQQRKVGCSPRAIAVPCVSVHVGRTAYRLVVQRTGWSYSRASSRGTQDGDLLLKRGKIDQSLVTQMLGWRRPVREPAARCRSAAGGSRLCQPPPAHRRCGRVHEKWTRNVPPAAIRNRCVPTCGTARSTCGSVRPEGMGICGARNAAMRFEVYRRRADSFDARNAAP